jgi:hypothetical protein
MLSNADVDRHTEMMHDHVGARRAGRRDALPSFGMLAFELDSGIFLLHFSLDLIGLENQKMLCP